MPVPADNLAALLARAAHEAAGVSPNSDPDWDRTNKLKDITEGNGRPRGGFFVAVGQDSQCQFPTAKCLPVATTPLQAIDFARPRDLNAQEANRE